MIYNGTIITEQINVTPMDDVNGVNFVELIKYGDEPIFSVGLLDNGDEWYWEFVIINPSDYERVKFNVLDAIFECDTMGELALTLDEIFTDGFADILLNGEDECAECKCHMCCGNC